LLIAIFVLLLISVVAIALMCFFRHGVALVATTAPRQRLLCGARRLGRRARPASGQKFNSFQNHRAGLPAPAAGTPSL